MFITDGGTEKSCWSCSFKNKEKVLPLTQTL